LEGEL